MSGSTLASRAWPSCPLVRSFRTLATCVGRRGRWPGRRSHWQGRRRGRTGASRRCAGSLSSIAGSGIPAWTHITSWPTASPAITKRSMCRTWPCPHLARTRLAKSVADAGWSTLAGLLAGEGAALPTHRDQGQCLVPLEPAVLGVSVQLRDETPGGQVLDLHGVWRDPRSGPECCQEHSG